MRLHSLKLGMSFNAKSCALIFCFTFPISRTALAQETPSNSERDQSICSVRQLDQLKLYAQSLNELAVSQAEKMKDCIHLQDEVLLWLAFYYRAIDDYSNASTLSSPKLGTEASERDQIFAAARAGQTQALQERIDSKTDSWNRDAEAQLILSRSLARSLEFERSRQAYADYLNLKSDDEEVRIESYYLDLWDGRCEQALANFDSYLARTTTPTEVKLSAQRGAEQSRKCLENRPLGEQLTSLSLPLFLFNYSFLQTSDDFSDEFTFTRHTLAPAIRTDWGEFGIKSHRMIGTYLDGREVRIATEAYARSRWKPWSSAQMSALAGLFIADKIVPQLLGDLIWALSNTQMGIDASLIPMAPEVRLPPEWRNATRLGYGGWIGYKSYVKYRIERKQVESFFPSTSHSLLGRIPIGVKSKNSVLLYAENEQFEGNNTLFYSPKDLSHGTIGLEHRNYLVGIGLRAYGDFGVYSQSLHKDQQGPRYAPSSGTMFTIEAAAERTFFQEIYTQLAARIRDVQNQKGLTTYREWKFYSSVFWEIP